MSEQSVEPGSALVLPASGVLVNLEDEREIAIAYRDLKALKDQVTEAERILREAMRYRSEVLATKTFHIEGVGKVELQGGQRTDWPDPQHSRRTCARWDARRQSSARSSSRQVTWRVDGNRARRAAGANSRYAAVIDRHRKITEPLPSVHIT